VEVEQLNTEITHLQNEAEVKQMKEYASKREKQKDTDGQSFQEVTRKCQTLEDQMESKTKELEDCHECIEKMKAILRDKEKEVSLIRELCENYKSSTQAYSATKVSLEESLTIANQVRDELGQKNRN